MPTIDPRIAAVTDRIIERSKPGRARYLAQMADQAEHGLTRPRLSCGNFAHGFAAAGEDKADIRAMRGPNIGIVTAFNDMLSAHQPYERYPTQVKLFAREVGATAQVAGRVPAMCDGVTQGQDGMDLSLMSRDVIAMGTAVALSHGMFDGIAMLDICDKIVPGLLIGALRFGHLPPRSRCSRIAAMRSHCSPTGGCRAPAARFPPRSIAVPRRSAAARCRGCAMGM